MQEYMQAYIGGKWVTPPGQVQIKQVINPATEDAVAVFASAGTEALDAAVMAAQEAQPQWAALSARERAGWLVKIADAMQARRDDLVNAIVAELGCPVNLTRTDQVDFPIDVMRSFADLLADFVFEERSGNSLVIKEAAGVAACITPWNFPLHQIVLKAAAAMAAGCAVVVKPSEQTPLDAFILAEIVDSVGLPAGVFNLVVGSGGVVGEAMASHPGVDVVSFTGSTEAGTRVYENAAAQVKRVALEMGGKSANIILDDADFETAVRMGVHSVIYNSGQVCNAHSRMLVPRDKMELAAKIAKDEADATKLIDPAQEEDGIGPLVSAAQKERVCGYIKAGVAEGAQLVTGGCDMPTGFAKGFYVRPTIFADVDNSMKIAQEEIFGPVLCIIPYDDEDDAVRIANDTPYGLSGGVWSGSEEHALAVARRMKTGQVDVNGGEFNMFSPFGGVKHSGIGREFWKWGIEEYLETKGVQF